MHLSFLEIDYRLLDREITLVGLAENEGFLCYILFSCFIPRIRLPIQSVVCDDNSKLTTTFPAIFYIDLDHYFYHSDECPLHLPPLYILLHHRLMAFLINHSSSSFQSQFILSIRRLRAESQKNYT